MKRPFSSELILTEKISQATLRAYHVGFDQNKFRLKPLVEVISNVIAEFAFGLHENNSVDITQIVSKLREAAITVYDTEKYSKRGEFGELILHLLLRDFCGTIPLVSKIYFKDAVNVPIHGFDGVHITCNAEKKLWLGESKLYNDGKAGVKDLAADLSTHIQADYLRKEFLLISRKLPEAAPDIAYWREFLSKHQTLDAIFSGICVPMVCTYSSEIFCVHCSETKNYVSDFIKECQYLKQVFDSAKDVIKTNIDVILMLLPVPCKKELVDALHQRLKSMQNI